MRVQINGYELSEKEVQVLKNALDYYSQGCQGQFSELGHKFWLMMHGRIPEGRLTKIKNLFDQAQTELCGSTSQSYRIGSNLVSRAAVLAHRLELLIGGENEKADQLLSLMGFNPLTHDVLGGKPQPREAPDVSS